MLPVPRRVLVRSAILSLLLGAAAAVAEPPVEIDVSLGEVDGQRAISLWAADGIGSREVIDPEGFSVSMVPATDLDTVLSWPAGEWFLPPNGKYKFWIEGNGQITPYSSVLNYQRVPFEGQGTAAVMPVEPAGTVALAADVPITTSSVLRLIHLDSHNRAPFPLRELSRSVRGAAMQQGALMPEGLVVAALVDSDSGDYLALSRPAEVRRDAVTTVHPQAPRSPNTDLLVRLERPVLLTEHEQYDVELTISGEQGPSREPDVLIPTTDRLYAIWYAASDSPVTLEVRSPSVFLPVETLVLRSGKVESFRGSMRALPDVEARLELPDSLVDLEDSELEVVLDRPSNPSVRKLEVPPGTRVFQLKNVVAAPVEIRLHAGPWTFRRPLDLSDGLDATVVFEPRPISVTGTVYLGDREHPATIEFRTNRDYEFLPFESDDEGFYEAELFNKGVYAVAVRLRGRPGVAHTELLERVLREDATLDFRLPDNRFSVRVVDAETREGIAGAGLAAGNKHLSQGGPLRMAGAEKNSVLNLETDDDGVAYLRPLHPGELTVSAWAKGYESPEDQFKETIAEGDDGREILIELEPLGDSTRLQLRWPDGRPATGAEVRLQSSLGNSVPVWSGTADGDGSVELPEESGTWVLTRHALGGWLIRPRPAPGTGPLTWTLGTDLRSLVVEVSRKWEEPARWARLAVWIEDRCVFGQTLSWFAGAPVAANGEGFWRASLPVAPLKILAWSSSQEVDPLALEGLATVVPVAATEVVEIETFD